MTMKRKWHILKRNKKTWVPARFIVFDTETKVSKKQNIEEHTLKLGWAVCVDVREFCDTLDFNHDWFYFEKNHDFWRWVDERTYKKRRTLVFAHNLHFDMLVTDAINQLNRLGYSLRKTVIESDTLVLNFRKDDKTIVLIDSLNFFKTSIEKLGKLVGLEKLKVDFETVDKKTLSHYCRRDVEILTRALENYLRFIVKHDLGEFKFTVAGQAFTAFRHRFMSHEIEIHANDKVTELERESYRGGRVECFRIGRVNERVYYLDVNSLYPHVMKIYDYPVALRRYFEKVTVERLKKLLHDYCVIAKVTVNTEENVFGVKGERLIFPCGRFRVTLCSRELEYGLKHNLIESVHECAIYKKAKIFEDYVNFFAKLKEKYTKENNIVMRNLAKLLMNSLYGKFGQRVSEIKKMYENVSNEFRVEKYVNLENNESGLLYYLGKDVFLKLKGEQESYNSFCAIASEVTANARMYLYELMKRAGLDNVFYVDTDSLFVNERGYENLKDLIDESRTGYLSLEGIADEMIINNCKDYEFAGKVVLKGVKKNSRKISENEYECLRFYKLKSALRKKDLSRAYVEKYIKRLDRTYRKGVVLENGRVIPFRLSL